MSARKRVTARTTKNKRVLARRAAKMLHEAWSTAVRERDGYVCQLCGSADHPQGHHWYIGKRECPALAHEVDNGICLCQYCHQILTHKQGTYHRHAKIRAIMVLKLGAQRVNELVSKALALCKRSERPQKDAVD